MELKLNSSELAARIDAKIAALQEIDKLKYSNAAIGRYLADFGTRKVSGESVRTWREGLAIPSFDKLEALAAYLGTTSDWLLYGVSLAEEMRVLKSRVCVSDIEFDLIKIFRTVAEEHQKGLLAVVKAWADAHPSPENVVYPLRRVFICHSSQILLALANFIC